MTDHTEILKLIETVSPDDTAKLDEIDARVWAFLKLQGDFKISFGGGGSIHYRHNSWPQDAQTVLHHSFMHDQYTRSRDALKAIRPEGWVFSYSWQRVCQAFHAHNENGWDYYITSRKQKSEELAELHAIIQAIEYERGAR